MGNKLNKSHNRPLILSIAGSDPSSGAGIQADIKVGYALKAYVLTVITAVTVQNPYGVSQVQAMPTELVLAQLQALLETFKPLGTVIPSTDFDYIIP